MQPDSFEQLLLELVNAERAKVGAQPLAFNAHLLASSENHSEWMIASDVFSTRGPEAPTQPTGWKLPGIALPANGGLAKISPGQAHGHRQVFRMRYNCYIRTS